MVSTFSSRELSRAARPKSLPVLSWIAVSRCDISTIGSGTRILDSYPDSQKQTAQHFDRSEKTLAKQHTEFLARCQLDVGASWEHVEFSDS